MFEFILALLTSVPVFFRSRSEAALEILALRQQIVVLKRKRPRSRLNQFDRLFWIILRCVWSRWAEVLVAVKPETVVGWHRAGFRLFWKWRSRVPAGRPKTTAEIRALIRQLAEENATWELPCPTAEWVVQQLREAFSEAASYRYVILDGDAKFDAAVVSFLQGAGLTLKKTSVQSPWQNGIAERWAGSC